MIRVLELAVVVPPDLDVCCPLIPGEAIIIDSLIVQLPVSRLSLVVI